MHRTPLYDFHTSLGANMVDFAGWEMPLLYTSIIEEHKQVRASGGVFDVSHMGRVWITGKDARRLLERVCTRRIHDMQPGQARYSLVCNERGGVRDDVLVYRLDDRDFMVVVNASNREKLVEHFHAAAEGMKADIDDRTMKTTMVALQGPRVIESIGKFSEEIPSLKRYRFVTKGVLTAKAIVSRTGYTGEDGVEAIIPAGVTKMVMELVKREVDFAAEDAPIRPAGLGARDTLRLEAGMPLYGHELSEERSALESGLSFAMNLDKADDDEGEAFIGMQALKDQAATGPRRKLVGLLVEGRRSARQGMAVKAGDETIGEVTSACVSPTLGRPIAMAYLDAERADAGGAVAVDTGRQALDAEITSLPFYKAPKK